MLAGSPTMTALRNFGAQTSRQMRAKAKPRAGAPLQHLVEPPHAESSISRATRNGPASRLIGTGEEHQRPLGELARP